MGTWNRIITNANDTDYKNSNVVASLSGDGSTTTTFLSEAGTWLTPAGTADTYGQTTWTVGCDTDTNTTVVADSETLTFTGGDGISTETTADQVVTFVNTKPNLVQTTVTGNAGSVTNGVYTSGDQTIAGEKTFSTTIVGSINGNSATTTETTITSAQASAITANSLKNTNVSTSLSVGTNSTTALNLTSDGGADDVLIPVATTSVTGVMNSAMFDKLGAITALADVTGDNVCSNGSGTFTSANVSTVLSAGTASTSVVNITSDGGADDFTIATATTSVAGVMSTGLFDKLDAIEASADVTDKGNVATALASLTGDDTLTIGDSGNDCTVNINGNMTIQGTTTTKNSVEVNLGDSLIVLNYGETGTPSDDGGIEIERGDSTNAHVKYLESKDTWTLHDGTTESNIGIVHVQASALPGSSEIHNLGTLWMAGAVPYIKTA
jgi:hypothetical protein